jgi:hypothetical protein
MRTFVCQTCDDTFGRPVWHCLYCDHHYMDDECGNCHKSRGSSPEARESTSTESPVETAEGGLGRDGRTEKEKERQK